MSNEELLDRFEDLLWEAWDRGLALGSNNVLSRRRDSAREELREAFQRLREEAEASAS